MYRTLLAARRAPFPKGAGIHNNRLEKVGRINRRQGFIVGEYWLRFISPPPRVRQEMERRLNCYAIRQTNNPPCIPFVSRTVYTAVLHNPILRLPLAELIAGYSNFPLLSTRQKEKTTSGRDQFSIDPESRFFFTIFLCNRSAFVKCITLQ